jgi:hypothetical protein
LDNLLKKFGFKTPNITNVKISSYVTSFRKIIKIKTSDGQSPTKKKKAYSELKRKLQYIPIVSQNPDSDTELSFEREGPAEKKSHMD